MKNQSRAYGVILFFVALFFSLMYFWTPLYMDDWIFLYRYRITNGGSDEFVFSSWIHFIVDNSKVDNGRLANLFAPFFATEALGMRAIFPWLSGFAVASTIPFVFSFSGIKKYRVAYACVAFVFIVGFLPWRDSLYLQDYSLNYVFSTAITFLNLWLILRYDNRGWTYTKFVICLLLTLLAAGWHEEFALSISGAMGLWALLHPRKCSVQWWVIAVFYFVFGWLFLYTPGMIDRAVTHGVQLNQIRMHQMVYCVPQIVVVLTVFILILNRRGRKTLCVYFAERPFFICFAAMCVTFAVPLIIPFSPRMMYWPAVLSFVCLFRMCRSWADKVFSFRLVRVFTYMCFFLLLVQLSTVVYWQRKIYCNVEELYEKFRTHQSVFHNLIRLDEIPWWTLKLNTRNSMYNTDNYLCLGYYYHTCPKLLYVVPCGMENVTVENSEYIGGDLDMYLGPQGELWSRRKLEPYDAVVKYTFADGSEFSYVPLYGRFINNKGDTLTYLSTPFGRPRVVAVEYDDDRATAKSR